ncbi:FtsX-like permease family protein [Clostridium hydrogeniformans]|uniref:FtsX-like permease family protein n=1 Tax=Clostridium hydrogeniformans TaxID=349933 RepID=UPI0004801DC3|nr:FtsX-like permease family protein [Clostridium hydrogeniformans]
MKKLIFLLFTTTLIVINFLSIKQFEYIQFQSFNNNVIGEKWNIAIESGNPQKSKSENFRLLEDMTMQIKVNLQRVSYENDIDNKGKIVYYVSFFENDKYFKNLKLKTGKFLNINSDKEDFLSTIESNNNHQVGQLEIFHNFDPIEIRPIIAAENSRDIKGTYTVNGSENAEKFKKIASEYGFTVEISKDEAHTEFAKYPYQDMMYKASVILCLLIALAMLYDAISNYKEISVRYLLGYNFWQIGAYLFKKYIKLFISSLFAGVLGLLIYLYFYNDFQQLLPFLYFCLKNIIPLTLAILIIFIVTWLGTKTINISQMIKNKKPIKLLFCTNIIIRLILAVFLVLGLQQGISTFFTLKGTADKQEKWSILKDYSYLGIVSNSQQGLSMIQNDEEKRRFKLMYEELESQGSFFISPSSYYLDNFTRSLNKNPWGMDGRKVEINKNYLSVNPIIGMDDKPVKVPDNTKSNEITVILPVKFQQYENDIKTTIAKDYNDIYTTNQSIPLNVNIILVKNDQSYFTFSTNMASDNKFEIIDPIAVVVNSQFDPQVLAVSISMGYGYYTKNSENINPFGATQNTLKKYNFDTDWEPVSVAYSNVELKIANNKELLQLYTTYCGLFIILAAVLLFFSSMYYLEMNKKSLAIQWIFGHTFFQKHYLVYLSLLVFWNSIFAICYFRTSSTLLLLKIVLCLEFLDIILISTILSIKEYNITKQVLIES